LAGAHAGAEQLGRFRTEAEAIARLQHANVVRVFEVGEQGALPYFSMEFCAGGSPTMLGLKFSSRPCAGRDAVGKTTDQQIRNDGQQSRDDQQLPWINPMKHDPLIDHVEYQGEHENAAHILPPLAQQVLAVSRI
jgi:hypothetical protein